MIFESSCRTPVLLLVYNRPEFTAKVLAAVRAAQPATLLVAADGSAGDPKCQEVRELVIQGIDWPCHVETRFSETWQGGKIAVCNALDWSFERHEELIVLEDDCVPHKDFFLFCDAMLERYRHVPEIMHVCGSNLLAMRQGSQSYFFSRFGPVWGWGTWRRAWQAFDGDMKLWPEVEKSGEIEKLCPEPFEAGWRREMFDSVFSCTDVWDSQWAFARLIHHGLNIVPASNLISNIGFGSDATHTLDADDPRSALATESLNWPLMHPTSVTAWREADRAYLHSVVNLPKTRWSYAGLRRSIRMLLRR